VQSFRMQTNRVVLTYHSHNMAGNAYENNDHIALAKDLETLRDLKAEIVSLRSIAEAQRTREWPDDNGLQVAITFDDGARFDYSDFDHPVWGPQKGFLRILAEAATPTPGFGKTMCSTSFVLASPDARAQMARSPECGLAFAGAWLDDDWWPAAEKGGLISIGNHSWDHLHPAVDRVAQRDQLRGDFSKIVDFADADAQIRRSSDYILSRLPSTQSLPFAYPFGHVSKYLSTEYFPAYESHHRCYAAFSTEGRAIDPDDSVWLLPRVVCGWHWRSSDELRAFLRRERPRPD